MSVVLRNGAPPAPIPLLFVDSPHRVPLLRCQGNITGHPLAVRLIVEPGIEEFNVVCANIAAAGAIEEWAAELGIATQFGLSPYSERPADVPLVRLGVGAEAAVELSSIDGLRHLVHLLRTNRIREAPPVISFVSDSQSSRRE